MEELRTGRAPTVVDVLVQMDKRLEAMQGDIQELRDSTKSVNDWRNRINGGLIAVSSGVGLLFLKELMPK